MISMQTRCYNSKFKFYVVELHCGCNFKVPQKVTDHHFDGVHGVFATRGSSEVLTRTLRRPTDAFFQAFQRKTSLDRTCQHLRPKFSCRDECDIAI